MGYTHYFNTLKRPTDAQWLPITKACKEILRRGYKLGLISEEMDVNRPPIVTDELIKFNGVNIELGHETFTLARDPGREFCKTAQKKYDALVVACLIVAKFYAPDCFDVATDGGAEDWEQGRKQAIHALGARDGGAVDIGQNTIGLPPTFTVKLSV